MLLLQATLALALSASAVIDPTPAREDLTSHEWGTFTSVAGEDGAAVRWAPLSGPADLPCFVTRLSPLNPKQGMGLVRMETPVLYFYSPRPVRLSIRVGFPRGWITEWYPRATRVTPSFVAGSNYRNGQIEWESVDVVPGEHPEFPSSKGASHYFAARNTDSAPLRVGDQWEKLIFYRGIGDFQVPLRPAFTANGRLRIRNTGSEPIPLAIVFENRMGKLGYRFVRRIADFVEMDTPELTGDLDQLHRELADQLVEFGLYRKEALAMIETWRDSWFEAGMRVFYIVPRAQVDNLLPLAVTPAPTATARVFVGRVEVLSPWVRETIQGATTRGDVPLLMKFGRFLIPFAAQIDRSTGKLLRSPHLHQAEGTLYQRQFGGPACVE
ncbi:MAG: hypothetical protein ACKV22_26455 [Bryobacteraceae bacterium]